MIMKSFPLLLVAAVLCPLSTGCAALTAPEVIQLARKQLSLPAEISQGEMTTYRGEAVKRSCSFIMGKLWDEAGQTEAVRIDFKTAVNSIGDSALYADQRYLLKRAAHAPATQWLYLPALRRVRIVPFQPDDRLLQSHMLFYDLLPVQNFADYRYRFIDADEQAPVVEGTPLESALAVPYERVVFYLKKQGETYVVTTVQATVNGQEKIARFTEFSEIAPGYYRPQQLVISENKERTEFSFARWMVRPADLQLLAPARLETQTLTFPTVP